MLLENRVLFLVGEINHVSASRIIMQMLYLQSVKRDQDINLYINSPGGVVDDTLAIYDIMKFLTCDVATYCIGRAESGGAIVFMAGKKGKRFILPNAKVMIHQPFGGVYGQAADIEIQAEEILKTKETLINDHGQCTGQPIERIREDSERDRFFDAQQAVKYGICDEVLGEDSSRGGGGQRWEQAEITVESMLYLGIDHPAIACHDVNRQVEWYCRHLGCRRSPATTKRRRPWCSGIEGERGR